MLLEFFFPLFLYSQLLVIIHNCHDLRGPAVWRTGSRNQSQEAVLRVAVALGPGVLGRARAALNPTVCRLLS